MANNRSYSAAFNTALKNQGTKSFSAAFNKTLNDRDDFSAVDILPLPDVNKIERPEVVLPTPNPTRRADNHDILHSLETPVTDETRRKSSFMGMVNDVLMGDIRGIPQRIRDYRDANRAIKTGTATSSYLDRERSRLKSEIKDIDSQIKSEKRNAATYRARAGGGLTNPVVAADAQANLNASLDRQNELKDSRNQLVSNLHDIGGKTGLGDFLADFVQNNITQGSGFLADLDLVDYYVSRALGLIDKDDKEAEARARALQQYQAEQEQKAMSGYGKLGQELIKASGAAGRMMGYAGASGIVSNAVAPVIGNAGNGLMAAGSRLADNAGAAGILNRPELMQNVTWQAGNAVRDLVTNPTNLAISASSALHTFDDAKTKGANNRQAFAAGLMAGAAEYYSNKMFSGTPFEDNPQEVGYVTEIIEAVASKLGKNTEAAVGKFFNNRVVSYIFDKSGEGWEEVITGFLDPLIARITYDPKADLATADELLEEWIGGVLMSGVMGITEPITNFQKQKAEARQEKYNQTLNTLREAVNAGQRGEDFATFAKNNAKSLDGMSAKEMETLAKWHNLGTAYNEANQAKVMDVAQVATMSMGERGAQQLAAIYRTRANEVDAAEYYNAARDVYEQGRAGQEMKNPGVLSTREAQAMYDAGKVDSTREGQNEQSRNAGEGRIDRLDSTEQSSRVAESAEGQFPGEAAARAANGGQADAEISQQREVTPKQKIAAQQKAAQALTVGVERKSSKEAGLINGTDFKSLQMISEDTRDQWTDAMKRIEEKAAQNGVKVQFYNGSMALDDGNGAFTVRGLNEGDGTRIWIRADASEDIEKIADHELFHTAERRDPDLDNAIHDRIAQEAGGTEQLRELFIKYAEKLDGLSEDEIYHELFADAYAGIDIFAGTSKQQVRAPQFRPHATEAVRNSNPTAREVENRTTMASREGNVDVSPGLRKQLDELDATVVDNVVVNNSIAPIMASPEYRKPVSVSDLADMASHDTMPEWAQKYLNGGGDAETLQAIQQFDDLIWKDMGDGFTDAQKLLQALVPSGTVITDKYGPLRTNVEYRRSFDMDTSCPRTFQFTAYRNAIMKRLNRTLTFEESINLINLMSAYHQMIPCTYCYVENKRILKAAYYNNFYKFHNDVLNGIKDGLTIEDLRPKMYGWNAEKGKLTDAAEKTLKVWMDDKSGYNPTIAENYHTVNLIRNAAMHLLDGMMADGKITPNTSVNSLTNIIAKKYGLKSKGAMTEAKKMAADWRYDAGRNAEHMYLVQDTGEEFDKKIADRALELDNEAINYSNSASSAKTVDNYAPYGGELENISKEDRDYIMGMGGIRKHSSNDFRIDYVLDYFQFYADLAKGKWRGHTYTKNGDYVRIFGRTGDMINMSIAFNDTADGVAENVSEGMEHKLAKELRAAFPNAGVMAMVTSDKQLSYALNADWIDMIIPFHNSGLPKAIWYNMKAWADYTSVQSESLYNADDMKAALQSRGVDTKGMSAEEVSNTFYETFGVEKAVDTKTGKQFAPHFYPYETTQHGVTIPGHNNSKAKYMELCRQYGVHPRFDGVMVQDADGNTINVVDHPNYMKLVKETSRATENFDQPTIEFNFNKADPYLTEKYGKEYGKKSVTPMDYAMARLNEEAKNGGYQNAANDPMGIVDEFIRDYAGKGREIGWLSERAEMTKDALDNAQDKLVDETRKQTLEEFKKTEGEKPKPRERSNFYANMASREATPFEQRVSGDALLDAQDLIETVKDVGGEVDGNGFVTVYHRTSADNAASIRRTGRMSAKEDGLFFSTKELGQNEGYGDTVVALRIPAEKLVLDDIFDDEAHLRLPLVGKNRSADVSNYLVRDTNMASREVDVDVDEEYTNLREIKRDFQSSFSTDVGADRGVKISNKEKPPIVSAIKSGEYILNAGGKSGQVSTRYGTYDFYVIGDDIVIAKKHERAPATMYARIAREEIQSGQRNGTAAVSESAVLPQDESGRRGLRAESNGRDGQNAVDDGLAGQESESEAERDLSDIYGDPTGRTARILDKIEEYSYALKHDESLSKEDKTDLRRRIRYLREEFKNRGTKNYYSLEDVPPVESFGGWERGATFDEVKAAHPTLFELAADEAEVRNPTQITGTVKTYRKIYDILKAEGFKGKILDASSGLGVGTEAGRNEYGFDVDDIEPFPDAKYKPRYTDYSKLKNQYDAIISNAVLNVIPQDLRDAMVVKIGQLLAPGGRAFINVRGTDVKNASSKVAINEDGMEYFISDSGSYQKGFRKAELVSYLKDALGDGFTVEPTNQFGGVAAVVTKDGGQNMASRETDNRLEKQNVDLQRRLDAALADTKLSTGWRAAAKDVDRVTADIIDATSSKESAAIVAQKIRSLVEAASNGSITSAEMKDLALDIARGLLRRSSVLTTKDSTSYDAMRKYLKSVYINVPTELRKQFTDWKAFAAAHKAMRMKTDGVGIGAVYAELQSKMGDAYFPDLSSDMDKLQQIAEILDNLTPIYDNPYSVNMAEATEETANDILEAILDIGQAEPTYADKAKAREGEVRSLYQQKLAEQKEYLQGRIQEEADKRKEQTEAIRQHYAEMREMQRTRKQESADRQKLLRVAKRLQNRKLDSVNRAIVDQLVGDLDTVSVNLTNKSLTNLRELADWYESYKDDPNFLSVPQVEEKLKRLEKRHIGDMTIDEVRDLTDVLRSIENSLAQYGKMLRTEDRRLVSEMSKQSQENIRNTKGSKKNIGDWLVTNTLAPERLIRRLTGYNDSDPLYQRVKELSDGQRKMFDYQMRAEALFSKWTNDKKLIDRLRNKETVKIRGFVDGKETTVEITPDMRMALYLHSLNDQNLKHIMNGGVTIPDIELYRKGDVKEAYSRGKTVKMSPDMVRGVANGMSAEERAFANAAHRYFNGMSRDEINAVSEALLGYSLAQVENYFPIQTDDAFTQKEIDAIQNDGSIQGMGFTKERVNASNAIYLVPMTDVLNRSIQNHAKYVGMAIPVANMNKLWKANTVDGETDSTSGLKDAMRSKWGDRANTAIENILRDVQNPRVEVDDLGKALAKIRSNYAGAVLTLNASVALKQAASYPTAAAVLGWEPLAKAMGNFGKVDLDLIAKYTPLQWYRSKGFSTQELGDIAKRGGIMDKVMSAHITTKDGREIPYLNWIQGVDLLTTRKLWKASEYYVQANQKNLKVGTDDYYKAVAEIYNRVIEETQPNYTTMQRPQLLRTNNQLAQTMVMFKTQPFQNFAILYDAIGELRAAERMAKNGDSSNLAQAKKNAFNAITSNLASAAVFAAMTMAWALARRKKEKYEDDEGNFNPWKQLGKDVASSEFGMLPFGSDVYNLLAAWAFDEKYYGMSNITSDSISGALDSMKTAFDAIKSVLGDVFDGDPETKADPEKLARKLFAAAQDTSKLLGVPLDNVINLISAVYANVASGINGEFVTAYEILKLTKGFTSSANKGKAYDLLYKAYKTGDDSYEDLLKVMSEDFDEDDIKSAMENRMKKAEGVKSTKDLEQRWLPPAQREEYDKISAGVQKSKAYKKADEKIIAELETAMYNYAVQNKTGQSIADKVDGGEYAGLDASEYFEYLLALKVADKPKNGKYGTYTNEEYEAAIDMVAGLNDAERAYLWSLTHTSDKNNPYGTAKRPLQLEDEEPKTAKKKTEKVKIDNTNVSGSSVLSDAYYDPNTQTAYITYKSSGKTYTYEGISQDDWNAFKAADSKGSYVNRNWKGK